MGDESPAPKQGITFGFDPRYVEAVFHLPEHRVLGKRLRPFSYWHKMQLEFHNSPLLGGGEVRVEHLALAVAVCRSQYPRPARVKLQKGIALSLWMLWAERVDLRKECEAFFEYQADYHSPPKLWETPAPKGSTPRRRDVDDSIEAVSDYFASYGGTLADAWNMPIGEMGWMNVCAARRAGGNVMIWTPQDEREHKRHLKWRAAKIAEIAQGMIERDGLSPEAAHEAATKFYWKTVNRNLATAGFVR